MNTSLSMFILLMSATLALCQRPFFAGIRPIGYPETPNVTAALGDRFGEDDGTTQRLPVEAHGDVGLIDRLSKLPIDKQPFWFINWQAYEANRQNPQTYPQRPSSFNDPIPTTNNNAGSLSVNSEPVNSNSGSANPNSGTVNPNSGSANSNPGQAIVNPVTANLNSASTPSAVPNVNRFGESDANKEPVASINDDTKSKSKPNAENKPSPNSDDKKVSSTEKALASNSDSTNSTSEPEIKLEEAAPLLPSPIEPESTPIDGLKLKEDTSAEKKFRYFRT